MNNLRSIIALVAVIVTLGTTVSIPAAWGQRLGEPWSQQQLMEPDVLAEIIRDPAQPQPVILSVGPSAVIKNSLDMGASHEKEGLAKLRAWLKDVPRDTNIVIYCGCCPFDKCPNVRPAFNLLNEMKFRNHKLLNLSQNLKVNWIDHGYPVNE